MNADQHLETPINTTNRPDADAAAFQVSGAQRADFDETGLGLIGELRAIELDGAGGKKLFCRLPLPLKLALLARVRSRRTDGSRSVPSTPGSLRRR
jgi:hypothetical protein